MDGISSSSSGSSGTNCTTGIVRVGGGGTKAWDLAGAEGRVTVVGWASAIGTSGFCCALMGVGSAGKVGFGAGGTSVAAGTDGAEFEALSGDISAITESGETTASPNDSRMLASSELSSA